MKSRSYLYRFSLSLLFFGVFGCSSSSFQPIWERSEPPLRDTIEREEPETFGRVPAAPAEARPVESSGGRYPWEVWPSGRDLAGRPLQESLILQGDEYRKVGQLKEAEAVYREALRLRLDSAARDALELRLASLELGKGEPEAALKRLSDYFRARGRTEVDVEPAFALLFAYAYGSRGDYNQSLAWFSRANRADAGLGQNSGSAETGVRLLLRTVPTEQLRSLSDTWKSDSFASLLIGQELRERARPDYVEPTRVAVVRFWDRDANFGAEGAAPAGIRPGVVPVGVLLPLSGRYSRLGATTKSGFELALLGQDAQQLAQPLYRDTVGELIQGTSAFRELASGRQVPVVVGPLVSELATSVADLARAQGVTLLTFSKRSSFVTGRGVFRLGPTIDSQIQSLLAAVSESRGMRRFAVVTAKGQVGDFYADVFQQHAYERGLEVVFDAQYEPGSDTELTAIAAQIESLDCDAVFFPDTLTIAARFAGNLSAAKRASSPLLGIGTWDDPRQIAHSRTVMRGSIFVSPYFQESDRPVIQEFNTAYQRKYGSKPDFLAAQGFDAGTIVSSVLRRAQQFGVSFEEAMYSLEDYEGLTGTIRVLPSGELERDFAVVEIGRQGLEAVTPLSASGSGGMARFNPSSDSEPGDVIVMRENQRIF